MYLYMAIAAAAILAWAGLSQRLQSRKKTPFTFYGIASVVYVVLYFLQNGNSPAWFYFICAGLGFGAGLSVVYITMSVEQFGTNLRASAGISIPNMVRGTLPLMILLV